MEKYADFSKNEYIIGNVSLNNNFCEISISILKQTDEHIVYRAYFLENHSTNLINIGVIETKDKKGYLKVKTDFLKDTVVIMQKDTKNDKLTFICAAFFDKNWNVEGYLNGDDIYIKHKNIFSDIAFLRYKKNDNNFFIVTDFFAPSNLSSVKCVMFEKSFIYAFDKNGYFLIKLEDNIITIGIKPISDENPMHHLSDFAYIKEGIFYVDILLDDDGQYFINKTGT